jgi:DnaJ-class molecular chaperone
MTKRYPVKPPVAIGEAYEQKCNHCGGSGQEPGLGDLTCRECFGRGRRKWRIEECEACGGKGSHHLGFTRCKACRGRGWMARDLS